MLFHDLSEWKITSMSPLYVEESADVVCSLEMNASFKHNKQILKNLGFDPAKQDSHVKLFWLDGETYKPLTESAWKDIEKGVARL